MSLRIVRLAIMARSRVTNLPTYGVVDFSDGSSFTFHQDDARRGGWLFSREFSGVGYNPVLVQLDGKSALLDAALGLNLAMAA